MGEQNLNIRIKHKYDTEANWNKNNPVLLSGEIAITSDKFGKHKVGDGTHKWSELSYVKADLTKSDVISALGYTPPSSDTWRGIQDNLISSSTTESLSAAQGKILKELVDGKAPSSHTHTKSEVGLGNVDNTADATKSVKYAISAGSASSAAALTSNAGSSTQPVYFSGGKPVACSYTLGKSVPADALFTDHTYGNMKGATSSSAGSAGLVPAPNIGEQLKFLRADGAWVIPTNTTYSVGTSSYLGITKLYTETGSATDGTMTQNAITDALNGKAASSHTHNYAGSSSAGGAADSAVKLNTARNITIGNSTKSFDGTTNLSWSLNEIGIPTKSDIAACAVMYGGTTLSSSATVTDSAAQYKVISRSTGSTGDIFTKSVTLPKGLYSVMIRMKVSTISSSSNVFKLTIVDGSTTTTKYIRPSMFKTANGYTTLGTAVENTSGTLRVTLSIYNTLSNQTVCVDYLAITPAMVGVTSIA